jgi:fructosamine-3-kinase
MWNAISQHISNAIEFDFKITERTRVRAGEISESYIVSNDVDRYFVKINHRSFLPNFTAEVENLQKLRNTSCVSVPEFITIGQSKEQSFIVLNYHPIKELESSKNSYMFGQQLAQLHKWGEQKEYGFDADNYIGNSLQPNRWQRKWHKFFSEQRIGFQLQLLKEKGINFGSIDELVDIVDHTLKHHHPRPALLHGDLWQGNVANAPFGPITYDPACYWGDRECDIAMTELFGGFDSEFYRGYNDEYPMCNGYESRKLVYNFYHILNHCNLYGGHYLDDAEKHAHILRTRHEFA